MHGCFKFKHVNNSLKLNNINALIERQRMTISDKNNNIQSYTVYKTPTLKQGQKIIKNKTRNYMPFKH